MKIKALSIVFLLVPCALFAATRDGNPRVGIRASVSSMIPATKVNAKPSGMVAASNASSQGVQVAQEAEQIVDAVVGPDECRTAYRECMDDFCLLDESEGGRCSCSDNIKQSKSLIQEIQKIQSDAELLYTEGVEREKLGAKAKFVSFGESETAQKASRTTGIDLIAWVNGTSDASLAADEDIGDNLYYMAADSCKQILSRCDSKRAEMEEKLYQREIVKDCKAFDGYLSEQKSGAESNLRTAQAAVRSARLDMVSTTNKYNRGECAQALRACVADKGGCGVNFENCLDADLLTRRTYACENILDQCMDVRDYVLQDWNAESKSILANAEKYVDENMRQTCDAKIRNCLETSCGMDTDSLCLTDINVAANVCPIIEQCEKKIPGIMAYWRDHELAPLRTHFCQNDVDKCLRDKCGANFNAPECVGKKSSEITALCPQKMFPSCKNEKNFKVIVNSVLLQMDYQLVEGCVNYFAETLGRVCGTDMSCLPGSDTVAAMNAVPDNEDELRARVRAESREAVDKLFKQFDKEYTIKQCQTATVGRGSLKDGVSATAKVIAKIGAENRYLADFESKLTQLKRASAIGTSRDWCLSTYKVEQKPKATDENKNYSYIRSVSFEPSLCNCHVCRMQRVCETGGESKQTSMLKSATGYALGGASAGLAVGGWMPLILGAGGALIGGIAGYQSGGEQDSCQEVETCEDVDVSDVDGACRGANL